MTKRLGWAAGVAVLFSAAAAWAVKPLDTAERHLAMVHVGIMSAEENAKALYTLAAKPETYSSKHAQMMVKNMDDDIAQAETHLGELPPLAVGPYDKATRHMNDTRSYLEDAKNLLGQLQSTANVMDNPTQVKDWTTRIWKDLQHARKSSKDTASDFGLPTGFQTPG